MSDRAVLINLAVAAILMAIAALGVVAFDASAHAGAHASQHQIGALAPEREA